MKVISRHKGTDRFSLKIRITHKQAEMLRFKLKCLDRPIQYAGGVMLAQGNGWYQFTTDRFEEDWASDEQMMRCLLRKVRHILGLVPKAEEPVVQHTPKRRLVVKEFLQRAHKRFRVIDRNLSAQANRVTEEIRYHMQSLGLLPQPVLVPIPISVPTESQLQALARRFNHR